MANNTFVEGAVCGIGEGDIETTKLPEEKILEEGKMNEEVRPGKKFCAINSELLPLKFHFFFLLAGIACILPYLPVYARQLGISATGVGIVYCVIPFCSLIAKPLFGWIADRFRREKLLLIILIIICICFSIILIFIPPLTDESTFSMEVGCDINQPVLNHTNITCPSYFNETISCHRKCTECTVTEYGEVSCKESSNASVVKVNMFTLPDYSIQFNFTGATNCTVNTTFHCEVTCSCDERCCPRKNAYGTIQFWLFFLSNVFAGTSRRVMHSLSDSLCYDMLQEQTKDYGKQRLWGSVGRSVSPLLTGYLLDLTTRENKKDYSMAVYTMVAFLIVDIIIITKLNLRRNNRPEISTNICKDVCLLFTQLNCVVFAIAVTFIGILTGFYFVYFFWFLEELGASSLLIGINVLIRLVVEVPCFFYSGRIIKKIGHFNSVAIAFAAFAIRFLSYVFIYNPWVMLPVELTHGFTFGVFYASMTSFAKISAPAGTQATLQGLLGALFDGLGMAFGNILGGLGFDYYGGRTTFCIASVTSAVAAVLTFMFDKYFMYKNNKLSEKREKTINGHTPAAAPEEAENML